MARLKHGEHGTQVEVDDDQVESLGGDWKAVTDDADDNDGRRRKPSRKAADD
jgi:hypothetical protein